MIGNRVRIKPDAIGSYRIPWRDRFRRGLTGTVVRHGFSNEELVVAWDIPDKRVRYPADWTFSVNERDLETVADG